MKWKILLDDELQVVKFINENGWSYNANYDHPKLIDIIKKRALYNRHIDESNSVRDSMISQQAYYDQQNQLHVHYGQSNDGNFLYGFCGAANFRAW